MTIAAGIAEQGRNITLHYKLSNDERNMDKTKVAYY